MDAMLFDQFDGKLVYRGMVAADYEEADAAHFVDDPRCRLQLRPIYPCDRAAGDDSSATAVMPVRDPDDAVTYVSVRLPKKRITNTRDGVMAAVKRARKKFPRLGADIWKIAQTTAYADELGPAKHASGPAKKPRRPWKGMRQRAANPQQKGEP